MQDTLIIFDCDGVLIDSEVIACAADAEELTNAGFPFTTSEIVHRFSGVPSAEMFAIIEREFGRDLPVDLLARIEARVLAAYRSKLKPIPGVVETLQTLGMRFCVASSSMPSKLNLGLIETGLLDFFYPHIFSSALVARGKPAPDLFLHAAQTMGTRPENCIVVEDSIAGVAAAKSAGMPAIGFVGGGHSYPDHHDNLLSAGARTVCLRFEEIPRAISRLNGG